MDGLPFGAECVFWLCVGCVGFAYLGYPLVIWGLARAFGQRLERSIVSDDAGLPTVSLLIAAHNEEDVLEAKLRNALAMDYPREKLEIVVGSDGSQDATADIVRQYEGPMVRLLDYRQRRGKSAVLNSSVRELNGEIIVFSDANTSYDPAAIRRLVRWFCDPSVGVVCGRLLLTDPKCGQNVDSIYWRYETFLKTCEARLGALLGANGAIYAMRRSLYVPIPDNTIVDDFVIPLIAKLRHSFRIIYDTEALAYEETPATIGAEFRRRLRIGTGGYQSVGLLWNLLSARHGWTAFSFLSHKVLRWSVPFLLVGMLVSNALLMRIEPYALLLAAQAAFYVLAILGMIVQGSALPFRVIRVPTMFCSMNAALMVGFWRWMISAQRGTWQRTARTPGATVR